MSAVYYVETWDMDLQQFTPQVGVDRGPYTLFGLRKALRKLRNIGYDAGKGDNSTLVYSESVADAMLQARERRAES